MKLPSKKSKQSEAPARNPHLAQKRQQSYHYSAKRSQSDRAFDRNATYDNAANKAAKTTSSLSLLERVLPAFTWLLIVIALGYTMTLSSQVDVRVTASTTNLVDTAAVESRAHELLAGDVMNRTKLGIKSDRVEQELLKSFPEIAEVSLTTGLLRHRPQLAIRSASAEALISGVQDTYVVSDSGRALFTVDNAPDATPLRDLPTIQDQSSFTIERGKAVLSRSQLAAISEVRYQLGSKNIAIDSVTIRGGGGEMQVKPSGEPYYVRFNFFEDTKKASGTYLAVREQLQRENMKPAEYVDVRIPERAYIK